MTDVPSRRQFLGGLLAGGAAAALGGACGGDDHVGADVAGPTVTAPRDRGDLPFPGPRSNLLVIVSDDQDYESLAKMPYLSGQAWIEFRNHVANTPLCSPARTSLMTGLHSHRHGIVGNDTAGLSLDRSVAVDLEAAGYTNGMVGKHVGPAGRQPGWRFWRRMVQFESYHDFGFRYGGDVDSFEGEYLTDVVFDMARQFVETVREPWFLYLAPYAPHSPYEAAERHAGRYADEPIDRSPNFDEEDVSDKPAWIRSLPRLSEDLIEQTDRDRRARWEQLLAVDEGLQLLESIVPDDTIVVYTSDNGLSLGAHRWRHKTVPYQEATNVPLLVRWPGLQEHVVRNEVVGTVDVAPTLRALAEADPQPSDGLSLVPLVDGSGGLDRDGMPMLFQWPDRSRLPEELPTWWAWRDERWKYVEIENGDRELYDLEADPFELRNLAGDPEQAPRLAELALRVEDARRVGGRAA